ncbi:MAG: cation:proton antiporter [Xanthobacteraceae bacterium]
MLSILDLAAILLTLSAAFAWINHTVLGLPHNIGVLIMGLAASLVLIAVELIFHDVPLYKALTDIIQQIDFTAALMNGMLAFLLFAGALHVDLGRLRGRAWSVGLLATFGVLISTAVVGIGFWLAADALGLPMTLPWALVFGALISPTDPVAVISTLKAVRLPAALEIEMTGESLLNDGVGVVLFTILVAIASGAPGEGSTPGHVAELFFIEAVGGAVLGMITGYIAYRAMAAIDDYPIEVLITLALVTGTYAIAAKLHVSGPIAVVAAGLLIGARGPSDAMSANTERYLFDFWTLIDEILNSVLFLLIGLEVLVMGFDARLMPLALAAIPLVLVARFLAVAGPVTALSPWATFARGTIPILTWGGVRGGISVALALSLPRTEVTPMILAATYLVVLFTLIVQGLTLGPLARRIVDPVDDG